MCGNEKALARVVVKMLNTRRCDWPWRERIVTGESDCARCANPIPGSGRGVSIYVW